MKKNTLVFFCLLGAMLLALGLAWKQVQPASTQAEIAPAASAPRGVNHQVNAAASPAAQRPERLVISGQVIDARGRGLPGLQVQAISSSGVQVGEALSGSRGRFSFRPLPPGAYHLQVRQVEITGEAPYRLVDPGAALVAPNEAESPRAHVLVLAAGQGVEAISPEFASASHPAGGSGVQFSGQISGTITAEDNGLPLAYAYVNAYDSEGDYVTSAYSDWDGHYTLTGLASGEYRLEFAYYGGNYLTEWYNNKPDMESADPVAVTDGMTTPDINAALAPGGVITGMVTAEDTVNPLTDVYIWLYDSQGGYAGYGYPDFNGVYTVSALQTGNYYIEFEPYGSSEDYISEFYDDKPDLDSADPVAVVEGSVTSGIDAVLTRGGSISGTVTAEGSGVPLEGVGINLFDNQQDYVKYTNTDADGNYNLTGLPTGNFFVQFSPNSGSLQDYLTEYYNDKVSLDTADAVTVSAPDPMVGIDAELALGGKIIGQVTAEDSGLPLSNVSVYVYDANGDYVEYGSTNANGVYTITQLAEGSYRLLFSPEGNSGDYVQEYYNDKSNLDEADPIAVAPPQVVSGIDAELMRGGKISGLVTAQDTGTPLDDVDVFIYDCTERSVAYANTDENGVFTSTALASGTYWVYFDPYGDSSAYLPEYYDDRPTMETATPVNVSAPDLTDGIDAELRRGAQISGVVTAQDTGLPLEGVLVDVYNQDWNYLGYDWTDADGVYTTTGLPSGSYFVQFYAWYMTDPAYVGEYYNNQPSWETADLVQVTEPQILPGINAVLTRGGSISGQVSAEDGGQPLEDVYVDVYDQEWDYMGETSTDVNGVFTVTGLASGSYYVYFDPNNLGQSADYVSEYHADTLDYQQAQLVQVTAPNNTADIDASLSLGGKILCHVTAADTGLPIYDNYVSAILIGVDYRSYGYTDMQGDCVIPGLPSGNYKVYFEGFYETTYSGCSAETKYYSWEYYNDKPDWDTADIVPVIAPQTVDGIDAVLGLGTPPTPETYLYLPLVQR